MEMFEQASRLKLRFDTPKGIQITTEDLWNLPLTSSVPTRANLDDIARGLHKQLKSGDDVSFVYSDKKSDPATQLAFDVVRHVIEVKLTENKAAAESQAAAQKRQKIMEIIDQKEDQGLKEMSVEELRKMMNETTN